MIKDITKIPTTELQALGYEQLGILEATKQNIEIISKELDKRKEKIKKGGE